jgi:hypothetical protein
LRGHHHRQTHQSAHGNEDEARQIVEAKNNSERQPVLNLQIAKAYLAGTDNGITTRTWQHAIEALPAPNREPTSTAGKPPPRTRHWPCCCRRSSSKPKAKLLLKVLQMGTVSTNVYLRRLHNFCVDMNWLPWPLVPKRQWPAVEFKEKRGITLAEHLAIVARETNPERKAFYKLAWHLGASQSDLAGLNAEDVDWDTTSSATRQKTGSVAIMRFDDDMAEILRDLPGSGPLFPYLRTVRSGDRATEFKQRCDGLASRASRCTATAMRGPNAPRQRAIPNGMPR